MPAPPGRDAASGAVLAAVAAIPLRYANLRTQNFKVGRAYRADSSGGFGAIAYHLCGSLIGSRTWVVELQFPAEAPSASASQGQLFLSRFSDGWRAWFQYH